MLVLHCFDDGSFVRYFEIRKCEAASFVLRESFWLFRVFWIPYKFKDFFLSSAKHDIGILIEVALNL